MIMNTSVNMNIRMYTSIIMDTITDMNIIMSMGIVPVMMTDAVVDTIMEKAAMKNAEAH